MRYWVAFSLSRGLRRDPQGKKPLVVLVQLVVAGGNPARMLHVVRRTAPPDCGLAADRQAEQIAVVLVVGHDGAGRQAFGDRLRLIHVVTLPCGQARVALSFCRLLTSACSPLARFPGA